MNTVRAVQEGTESTLGHMAVTDSATACTTTREILNRIGDKWSLYIVFSLSKGAMRFMELKREISGISQRMLTLTLKGLEKDGLITRTVFPTIPPRVDYELTPLGATLMEPACALINWAEKHQPEIEAARSRFVR
jgi:DNA-binding HxlR family transcriptional regulator